MKIFIGKRHLIHGDRFCPWRLADVSVHITISQILNLRKHACFFYIIRSELRKISLSFGSHDSPYFRMFFEELFCIIGHLRATCPDLCMRKYFRKFLHQLSYQFSIPDITGKCRHIRLSPVNISKYLVRLLVNGIFCDLNLIPIFPGCRLQTVHRQIGMNVLCIDCHQQYLFHGFSLSVPFFFHLFRNPLFCDHTLVTIPCYYNTRNRNTSVFHS